jgi:hypothetical protein
MKAQFVFENISFKRGVDPKETMKIGNASIRSEKKLREFLKREMDMVVDDIGGSYSIRKDRLADWQKINIEVKASAFYTPSESRRRNSYKLEAWIYDPAYYQGKGYNEHYSDRSIHWRFLSRSGGINYRADINSDWHYIENPSRHGMYTGVVGRDRMPAESIIYYFKD